MNMTEKFEEGEFWLPAEFLDEDFFLEENHSAAAMASSGLYAGDFVESETDDDGHIAGLARQMAHSFLGEEKLLFSSNPKVMATSPQSTLCDSGIWSLSSDGSPNGPSQVSSPTSTPLDMKKDDALDVIYAAAGQVGRIKQNDQRAHERWLLIPPNKPSSYLQSPDIHRRSCNLTQQQLQAAQFFQLKQQQLIKQQVSAAWNRQNRAARNNRLSSSWTPIQRQQQCSGMRAVFLNNNGSRRESTGTGVFLPRRACNSTETRKKPSCSTVLLPARVVQALNLNIESTLEQPRYPSCISFDNEQLSFTRRTTPVCLQKPRYLRPPPAIVSGHEIRLPREWTY